MNELDKRELLKLIEQYGELKGEIGENKSLLINNTSLEVEKDLKLSKIINIIKEL